MDDDTPLMLFIFVNSISIMILYLLSFSLFYQLDSLKYRQDSLEKNPKGVTKQQLKNLVHRINYNDQYLKKYIDHVHYHH